MKARSPAEQTFAIQLAGSGTYLPTDRAVRGGDYSAIVESNAVGPEGGYLTAFTPSTQQPFFRASLHRMPMIFPKWPCKEYAFD